MKKNNKALVVFSGGQDSTTCLYWALKKFGKNAVTAITFSYGQRHARETGCARAIARMAGVPLIRLNMNTFTQLGNNALTGTMTLKNKAQKGQLPNTFVPGRNIIFLTLAAAYAYAHNIGNIITGVCETDYSGYPDCRLNTIRSLEKTLSLGLDRTIKIHTPLIHLTKAASIRLAKRLGALPALAHSHTCYRGVFPPCGKCMACKLRAKGFRQAGIPDPLLTRPSMSQTRPNTGLLDRNIDK